MGCAMQIPASYEIELRGRDGEFVAGIPQLDLYVRAESAQKALELLEEKKASVASGADDFGEFDDLRTQPDYPSAARRRSEYATFAVKCAIAIGMSTAAMLLLFGIISAAISPTLKKLKPLGSREILAGLEERLHRAAQPSESFTEERKQKILADVKIVAEKWGPFINDLLAILEKQKNKQQ